MSMSASDCLESIAKGLTLLGQIDPRMGDDLRDILKRTDDSIWFYVRLLTDLGSPEAQT